MCACITTLAQACGWRTSNKRRLRQSWWMRMRRRMMWQSYSSMLDRYNCKHQLCLAQPTVPFEARLQMSAHSKVHWIRTLIAARDSMLHSTKYPSCTNKVTLALVQLALAGTVQAPGHLFGACPVARSLWVGCTLHRCHRHHSSLQTVAVDGRYSTLSTKGHREIMLELPG